MLHQISVFIKSLYSKTILLLKRSNRLLLITISICVSIIILGLLIYRQWDILINFQWQFRPLPILLTFLFFTAGLFWAAIVWGWIMNSLGERLNYKKHIRYFIISNIAKRIPGTVWYIAGRVQLYANEGQNKNITAMASGIEMVLIMLAGILVALVISMRSILKYYNNPIFLIVIFIVGSIVLHPKVIRWIMTKRKVEVKVFSYFSIIKGILYYVVAWILGGVVLFEIGNIIYPISTTHLAYFINSWVLVGVISTLLFFSPSNFGVTEIGLSLLLSNIIPSSIAVIIAIVARILMTFFEIVWAGFFLMIRFPQKRILTQKD